MNQQAKILICPLDWGLGHATRCMPLIAYFLEKKWEVIVAGNIITNQLIQTEFPNLTYLLLKGYEVKYASSKYVLPFKIMAQIPKILGTIKFEHAWLQQIIETHQIDIVISDNRYGLYAAHKPCIFITHQLQIAVPQSTFLEKILNKINRRYLNKFTSIWVPDYEDHAMAGKLSTPQGHLKYVSYLGNLSRFQPRANVAIHYDLTIVLSGPEPQRTLLENIILQQLQSTSRNTLLIRGNPRGTSIALSNPKVQIVNYLGKKELETALLQSHCIVCRSGYSSIMDLIKLNKHAVLIPTPGQTEQEYLAKYLNEKKWFQSSNQINLNLDMEFNKFQSTQFESFPSWSMVQYQEIMDAFISSMHT